MNATIEKIKTLINSKKFLVYLIALVLSTLMLGYATNSISLGLFIFFSIRYYYIFKGSIKITFTLLLPIILYLLFCLTILWSVDLGKTIIGLERTIALCLIPIAFSIIPKFSKEDLKEIFKYFTFSNAVLGLFFLIVACVNYIVNQDIGVFVYHSLVSIFDFNAIYVSLIFSMSLFYLLSKKNKSKVDIAFILFFILLLIMLSSKTILFVFIISIFIYFSFRGIKRIHKTKFLFISIIFTAIIGVSSFSIIDRVVFEKKANYDEILSNEKFSKVYPWTGSSIRLLQLRILNEQIQEDAIFWKGFGLFASRENMKKRHQEFNIYKGFHDYNYHNQYAQILSETGIFGLILILLMLMCAFANAWKSKSFLFLMFCITMSLLFFTESLLWRQKGLFLFVVLYSLFNSSRISIKQNE